MASVCGASLSLMDAGVPITTPVAGIAMGLIVDKNKFAILSDITGDEDHLGDMDFKVAGTKYGITAMQMDIKVDGIRVEILTEALIQAREGRTHILDIMNEVISQNKSRTADHAPQIAIIKVDPHKVRDVIGKGGIVIKRLVEKTGSLIETYDNGEVKIFAQDKNILQKVVSEIRDLTVDVKVGQIYLGNIVKVLDFGVYVSILSSRDGLLLFSDAKAFGISVENLQEGFSLKVAIQHIDRVGKIKLLPV